jgi:hypothetical protein
MSEVSSDNYINENDLVISKRYVLKLQSCKENTGNSLVIVMTNW